MADIAGSIHAVYGAYMAAGIGRGKMKQGHIVVLGSVNADLVLRRAALSTAGHRGAARTPTACRAARAPNRP